jgi:hypothetical protein
VDDGPQKVVRFVDERAIATLTHRGAGTPIV